MSGTIVKIFGERNTGTRALQQMLRQVPGLRFRVESGTPVPGDAAVEAAIETRMKGAWKRLYLHALRDEQAALRAAHDPWKHAAPRLTPAMVAAGVRVLILVRDPYSWLIGLARRPYHLKGPNERSLEEFAARPWMTERREGLAPVLASPVDLWALKAAASLACRAEAKARGLPCAILRFEDFVRDPGGAATAALAQIGIEAEHLAPRQDNTKPGEDGLPLLQRYYRDRLWQARLTRETVARVNARIDWAVAAELGYAPLDPERFPRVLPPALQEQIAREMACLTTPTDRADA
ncbi:hypothetical protein HMH01_07450 [Halovulum dunhuangense]|uniref:Sulfotransferase family protein n=1 Tax=Halovulum dunhuangense TaxID=1505036 RepID=A0A849L1X8_9RHOB|nr:hypothetical protein [Halovulum dunhuangense]NNU80273.1 hypothetical protein [Halovulum dunhuangense]